LVFGVGFKLRLRVVIGFRVRDRVSFGVNISNVSIIYLVFF